MSINFSSLFNLNKLIYLNWFNIFIKTNWSILVLSLDYFSIIMILLSSLLIISCIIISWNTISFMIDEFYILLVFTHYLLIMLFISYDLSLFYVFFELILIPIFIIIIVWGSRIEKFKAAYYLFFYTLFGSLLMLTQKIHKINLNHMK